MKRLIKSTCISLGLVALAASVGNAMIIGADSIKTSKGVVTENQLYNACSSTLYSVTLSPATVSANSTATYSITVTGIKATDMVQVFKPGYQAGIFVAAARAKAANTVWMTLGNITGSDILPTASETYKVLAIRN